MSDPLISDRTRNQDALSEESSESVLLVNLFTPKEGQEDDFMRAQVGEYERLNGQVPGWIGNRLGRAVDGSGFVNIALFESLELYQNWRNSETFSAHVEVIRPYLENSAPGMYEIVYSSGNL